MVVVSLQYGFEQKFRVPAKIAYAWCTDFGPEDGAFFPGKHLRSVRRIAEDALVLTDTTYPEGSPLKIRRLVRLNQAQMAWTNTHLDGPYKNSQYWYRIKADGPRASHLEFTGMRLVTVPRPVSRSAIAKLAAEEREGDSKLWRESIAPSLEEELAR